MDSTQILEQAANSVTDRTVKKPAVSETVAALLESEQAAKKNKNASKFEQLIGNWRLCLISGKQTPKTAKKSGQYLPIFINIQLSYSANTLNPLENIDNLIARMPKHEVLRERFSIDTMSTNMLEAYHDAVARRRPDGTQ